MRVSALLVLLCSLTQAAAWGVQRSGMTMRYGIADRVRREKLGQLIDGSTAETFSAKCQSTQAQKLLDTTGAKMHKFLVRKMQKKALAVGVEMDPAFNIVRIGTRGFPPAPPAIPKSLLASRA